MDEQKRCFVVMGFGIKTDFATGRKLDLNKSYRLLIKPVVEQKGLICIRADEIRHTGVIDVPMYHELLKADVVVADLSTANVNAFYELGIRHAMRPRTTIVISEDKLTYPFDLNHIKITSYTHLGDAIDFDEVERFRTVLGDTIDAVLGQEEPDSPVYTYLNDLVPPSLQETMAKASEQLGAAIDGAIQNTDKMQQETTPKSEAENPTLAILTEQAEEAILQKDYQQAKMLFKSALYFGNKKAETKTIVNNPYLIQRLALSTYKAREPDEITAFYESIDLLDDLDLSHTNDPETVSLAGAIEKKLYERGEGDIHLENALQYFARAYYLLNNRYNGINLAFLLNCKANSTINKTDQERIADLVYANRTRQQVLRMCEKDWQQLIERANKSDDNAAKQIVTHNELSDNDRRFWILVNKAEASFALGDFDTYEKAHEDAKATQHADWMMKSFEGQLEELKKMLAITGYLINPVWKKQTVSIEQMPLAG